MGMTMVELNQYIQDHEEMDFRIDGRQKEFIENNEEIVMDGRVGFYLAPGTIFNVFLDLDPRVAATRILADREDNHERKGEMAQTVDDMVLELQERARLEEGKLKNRYDLEGIFDPSNFDLVVDTGPNNLEQVVEIVRAEYEKWLQS